VLRPSPAVSATHPLSVPLAPSRPPQRRRSRSTTVLSWSGLAGHRRRVGAIVVAALLATVFPTGESVRGALVAAFASAGQAPAAPGTIFSWGGASTSIAGGQTVELVDVDLATPGLILETSLAQDHAVGLETVTSQARRASREGHRVVAAINGDVWNTSLSPVGPPNGFQIHAGELLVAGTGPRPAFAVDAAGRPRIGTVDIEMTASFPDGFELPITRLNQARQVGEIDLFTPRFGPSTRTDGNGTEVVLTGAPLPLTVPTAFTATVAAVRVGAGDTPIGPDQVVLSAPNGGYGEYLAGLSVGQSVTIRIAITPGWEGLRELITGRESLVVAGQTQIQSPPPDVNSPNPRSALGLTANGHLILLTVDGRQPGLSGGMTLPELADLLRRLGVQDAIGLDDGGSSTLAVRQLGDVDVSVVNHPSDGRERPVANALLVVSTIPTGPLAGLVLTPVTTTVQVGDRVALRPKGYDAAYNGIPVDGGSLTWHLDGPGQLSPDGTYLATAPGTASVAVTLGSLSAQATIVAQGSAARPTAAPPTVAFPTRATVAEGTVPLRVTWPAATAPAGLASYALTRSVQGSPWVPVSLPSPTTTAVTDVADVGLDLRYAITATDGSGATSAPAIGPATTPVVVQDDSRQLAYTGSWTPVRASGYLGGSGRVTTAPGARVRLTFGGSAVAIIAPLGPTRGRATVVVDGKPAGTIDLYRSSGLSRQIVYATAWPTAGTHTIELVAQGTPGRPRVDLDGFLVLRPPPPEPLLVAAGDIASCGLLADSATADLVDGIPGIVAAVGDNAYERGTAWEYATCYGPTWGRAKARTRPVPGNHDYLTAGASGYFGYFGAAAGSRGQGWYAYDLGTWRIYALNSNCGAIGGCGPTSPEVRWLQADLAANPRACVLAYWHHPRFSSGVHGNASAVSTLWQVLYAAGAEVVINGHDHDYERFAPQNPNGVADPARGIREFVVGTGGASLRGFVTRRANSEVRSATSHGVLVLTLGNGRYSWRFIAADGSFTDAGSASCH
jgi:hypothetical protein